MEVRVRALDRVLRAHADLGAELVLRQVPRRLLGRVRQARRCSRPTPAATPPGGSTRRSTTSSRPRARCADDDRTRCLMGAYILRRLLLIVPTLFGILLVNFILVQFMPGGPIEQVIAELESQTSATDRISRRRRRRRRPRSEYRGAQGLPPEFIAELERQFGFDKPAWQRFLIMLGNYLTFDFGESYFRSISVVDLVLEKMPVSITLGLWSTLLAYLISIPLGIRKAVRDGTRFDTVDLGRDHRRLRDPLVPLRGHAARALRRRLLLAHLPAARPHLRQLGRPLALGQGARLPLAHHPAGDRLDDRRLRHDDAADQELVPRRDPQAVRDDRPRQGPDRGPRPLRPRLPQRHADRDRRLPGGVHRHLLRRLA